VAIQLSLPPGSGFVAVDVSEEQAAERPGSSFASLAESVKRFGFELVAPMTGDVVMTNGELTGAQLDLVLLRHRETPDGEAQDEPPVVLGSWARTSGRMEARAPPDSRAPPRPVLAAVRPG
jgi:hypothetical protein